MPDPEPRSARRILISRDFGAMRQGALEDRRRRRGEGEEKIVLALEVLTQGAQ
jgi:hypothetical protein